MPIKTKRKKGKKKVEEVEQTPQEKCVSKLEEELAGPLDLFMCSKLGLLARVQKLLENEKVLAKLEAPEPESGNTALILAAKNGKLAVIELLLEKGANVNAKGYANLTALHYACRFDMLEVTHHLVNNAGADINAGDEVDNKPLHEAARMGNLKCVEVLLQKGADLEVKNKLGSTPFQLACLNARSALVEVLLKRGVDKDAQNAAGETALIMAAAGGLSRLCKQLLDAKADPNLLTAEGKSAEDLSASVVCKQILQAVA